MLRKSEFRLTWNDAFGAVMAGCAERRTDGTWILPEMVGAYERLHALGHAHSLEVWFGDELVAGVYGVQVGGLFAAESKFHRRTDMSKVALVALVRSLSRAGVELVDVQFATEHLRRLGAVDYELGVLVGNRSWNLLGSWIIPGQDDGTVGVEAAKVEGMRDFRVVPASHTWILRSPRARAEVLHFLENGAFSPAE